MWMSCSDMTGGYVSGGPGMQRYSADGEGSTLGGGGIHKHGVFAALTQQGSWCRISTLLPIGRRNLMKEIPCIFLSETMFLNLPLCCVYCSPKKLKSFRSFLMVSTRSWYSSFPYLPLCIHAIICKVCCCVGVPLGVGRVAIEFKLLCWGNADVSVFVLRLDVIFPIAA